MIYMKKDLSKKIDNQNAELKRLSECFDNVSFIVNNTDSPDILRNLKKVLKDLNPILKNLEHDITELGNSLLDEPNIIDNNTLLISEVQNKVVLPYTVNELQKILDSNSNYTNLQDVIDKVFTIPIDKYKNSLKSRFKETYNLMRKKENSSLFDSLNLALELSFNNLLNPAIITACKNLDELDVYLDCLSSNELDKFKLFNIKYEILPKK